MPTEVAATSCLSGECLRVPAATSAFEGQGQGHGRAGDGGGARAAVGLDHVAVEDDGALAEGLHVDDRAQAAADEALNLVGAAADLAAFALARGAGDGGAGQHGVLGRDPAAAGVAQPAGDALLDGGVGEHAGVAERDEDGAFGGLDEAGSEGEGAKLGGGPAAGTEERTGSVHRGIVREQGRGTGEQAVGTGEAMRFQDGNSEFRDSGTGIAT